MGPSPENSKKMKPWHLLIAVAARCTGSAVKAYCRATPCFPFASTDIWASTAHTRTKDVDSIWKVFPDPVSEIRAWNGVFWAMKLMLTRPYYPWHPFTGLPLQSGRMGQYRVQNVQRPGGLGRCHPKIYPCR
jgi:hypothetical protein